MNTKPIRKRIMALAIAVTSVLTCAGLFMPAPQANASSIALLNRKGVILVSRDPWVQSAAFTGKLGHSGIVYSTTYVVESVSSGVSWGNNNWEKVRNAMTAVTTHNMSATQDANAAEWARNQIGKPYNWNFYNMGTRTSFYCSQLIWAAYKDKYGLDLNTSAYDAGPLHAIAPTELISTPKTYTLYSKN